AAREGEARHLRHEAAARLLARREDSGELDGVGERVLRASERDGPSRVDGEAVVRRAVLPDAVVVLEGEAQRIHDAVTPLRARLGVVLGEALPRRAARRRGLGG